LSKIITIVILMLLFTGCFVKRVKRGSDYGVLSEVSREKLDKVLKNQNITNESFFIEKADIEVIGQEGKRRLIASLKFSKPDQYLLSVRNKTGIELARIFLSPDTLLVKDRINRKQYCASPNYLSKEYGLKLYVLPVVFGDFVGSNILEDSVGRCIKGILNVDALVLGTKLTYSVDCSLSKSILTKSENGLDKVGIEMRFKEFYKSGKRWIPQEIEISDLQREVKISIKIRKLSYPWDGNIDFVPGNKYEIIPLL